MICTIKLNLICIEELLWNNYVISVELIVNKSCTIVMVLFIGSTV